MEELEVTKPYVMPELRDKAYKRLSSIEGQVRGLKKMLEDGRPCVEILVQLSAAQEALRQVSKIMMRNYLERCATYGIKSDDPEKLNDAYDEIMDVIFKHLR